MPLLTPDELETLALSLKVSGAAIAITTPIAFCLAWLLARVRFPGKMFVDALVHLPLVVPPVVTGYLLLLAFGRNGPIGAWLEHWFGITVIFRWTGAAIAAAVMALPLMVRAMRLSIEAVDPRLEDAARTLGASPLRAFFTITVPLSFSGILAGAVVGFAKSLGEFGATITFVSNIPGETRTLSIAIYSALQIPGAEQSVMRLTLLSIAVSLGALVLSEILARRVIGGRTHVL